jgi:hypothetical protein
MEQKKFNDDDMRNFELNIGPLVFNVIFCSDIPNDSIFVFQDSKNVFKITGISTNQPTQSVV